MKVVSQLIHHFWDRRALSFEQAEHLVRQGFVRPEDLRGFMGRSTDRSEEYTPWPDLEDPEDEFADRPVASRRGKAKSSARELSLDELAERLREEFDRRTDVLFVLMELAKTVGPCDGWDDGAVALRNVQSERFGEILAGLIRRRPAALGELWQAVDPEPFHVLAGDRMLRGSAVRAFQALLQHEDSRRLGKYAWVLRCPEIAVVSNMLRIHRRLLGVLYDLYARQDSGLSNALHQWLPDALYWAFVYLYNARRTQAVGEGIDPARESEPLERPHESCRRQAVTSALVMNPGGLLRLLEIEDQQQALVRPWSWRTDPSQ